MTTIAVPPIEGQETFAEDPPVPLNKYLYAEFAGFDGERYLKSLLRKILPLAMFRTWQTLSDYQAPGNDIFLGIQALAKFTNLTDRKIRLDLEEFKARLLLTIRPGRKLFRRADGTVEVKMVAIKDFGRLYDLAHEYHLWSESDEYIPAERDFVDVILEDELLTKKLLRFNHYRRLLCNKMPGPKSKEKSMHRIYAEYQQSSPPSIVDGNVECTAEHAKGNTTGGNRNLSLQENLQENLKKDSQERVTSNPDLNGSKGDSFDSELTRSEGDEVTHPNAYSHTQAYSDMDYTNNEQNESSLPPSSHTTKPTNQSCASQVQQGGPRASITKSVSRHERDEDDPRTKQAQQAAAFARQHPEFSQLKNTSQPKLPPKENVVVGAFVAKAGVFFYDRNPKGSRTGVLRIVEDFGMVLNVDILACLVAAYNVAIKTPVVVEKHRHPDGDNKMPLFVSTFRKFAQAWSEGTFQYTLEALSARIADDERLKLWIDEISDQQAEPMNNDVSPRDEQLLSESLVVGEANVVEAPQEVLQAPVTVRRRTAEEKRARLEYATRMKWQVSRLGVSQPQVEHEHHCGCPLYYTPSRWGQRQCAYCQGDDTWSNEIKDKIASIVVYGQGKP